MRMRTASAREKRTGPGLVEERAPPTFAPPPLARSPRRLPRLFCLRHAAQGRRETTRPSPALLRRAHAGGPLEARCARTLLALLSPLRCSTTAFCLLRPRAQQWRDASAAGSYFSFAGLGLGQSGRRREGKGRRARGVCKGSVEWEADCVERERGCQPRYSERVGCSAAESALL
jgi:hypothetical protein